MWSEAWSPLVKERSGGSGGSLSRLRPRSRRRSPIGRSSAGHGAAGGERERGHDSPSIDLARARGADPPVDEGSDPLAEAVALPGREALGVVDSDEAREERVKTGRPARADEERRHLELDAGDDRRTGEGSATDLVAPGDREERRFLAARAGGSRLFVEAGEGKKTVLVAR